MYYEEKIINGVLMFRGTPNDDWRQCSIEEMSQRIIELEKRVAELSEDLAEADSLLAELEK